MYDAADNFISSYTGSILHSVPTIYPIRLDCVSGKFLKVDGGSQAGIVIEGKFDGTPDAYVSLEGAGLDLASFHGQRVTILVRVTGDLVTSKTTKDFDLIIE